MTRWKTMLGRIAALALAAAGAGNALAQDWPSRPVTLVVPFAAGGNTDGMARVVAERLSKNTGRTFIVDNKGGAGGTIATEFVAKGRADGYTLLFGTVTQVATAPFTNRIRYDPVKDLVPISNVGGNPFVIAARPNAPYNTIPELVAWGKANPGKLTVGHAGVGGLTHLSAALFLSKTGLEATLVPYKGAAPALVDVLGGQTDFYSGNLSEILPHAKNGKLKLLGVSSLKRVEQLPDVPAIAEFYPGYQVETWNGLLGPAGMPPEAVNMLAAEMAKLHADPEFRAKLASMGITPIPEFRDDFRRRIADDTAKWKPVIQAAGIVPE